MTYSNVVINLMGRDWETMNYKFKDVNVTGARQVARLARECGVKRLIHFSSLNASNNPDVSSLSIHRNNLLFMFYVCSCFVIQVHNNNAHIFSGSNFI